MESSRSVIQKPCNTAVRANTAEGGPPGARTGPLVSSQRRPRCPHPGLPSSWRGVTPAGSLHRRRSSHADNG